jgi:hypothetical protein
MLALKTEMHWGHTSGKDYLWEDTLVLSTADRWDGQKAVLTVERSAVYLAAQTADPWAVHLADLKAD